MKLTLPAAALLVLSSAPATANDNFAAGVLRGFSQGMGYYVPPPQPWRRPNNYTTSPYPLGTAPAYAPAAPAVPAPRMAPMSDNHYVPPGMVPVQSRDAGRIDSSDYRAVPMPGRHFVD